MRCGRCSSWRSAANFAASSGVDRFKVALGTEFSVRNGYFPLSSCRGPHWRLKRQAYNKNMPKEVPDEELARMIAKGFEAVTSQITEVDRATDERLLSLGSEVKDGFRRVDARLATMEAISFRSSCTQRILNGSTPGHAN